MGRNSAGVKAGTNDGGGQYKGKISRVGSLVEMKDKAMYKATKEAYLVIMLLWVCVKET